MKDNCVTQWIARKLTRMVNLISKTAKLHPRHVWEPNWYLVEIWHRVLRHLRKYDAFNMLKEVK